MIQTECSWVEEIVPTNRDTVVMSQQLVDDILDHNDKVRENCGGPDA